MEEVACVNQHIMGRLRDVLAQVQDYFVDSARATKQKSASKYIPPDLKESLDLRSDEAEEPW